MLFTTYLPTKYNDGSEVPASEVNAILTDCQVLFGGYSFADATTTGAWIDDADNTLYIDTNRRLEVLTDRASLEAARQFVVDAGRRLRQEAMYFEVRDYDGVQILDC